MNKNTEEAAFRVKSSEEFMAIVQVLDDFIENMPLPYAQKEALADMLLGFMHTGRRDAYTQGFKMGMEFCDYCRKNPEESNATIH